MKDTKTSWPNLRYYPDICLDRLRKITQTKSKNGKLPEIRADTSWIQVKSAYASANLL